MTINQAMTKARQMMKNHDLPYWTVTYNNRKRAFGVCSYRYQQIQLSRHLIPVMPDKAIINVIIHEIAHALTPGHHHDSVWQAKCIELGGNSQRCGGYDHYKDGIKGREEFEEKTSKWTLTCPICGAIYYRNRRPSSSISCGEHGDRVFNIKYKMILTQNH